MLICRLGPEWLESVHLNAVKPVCLCLRLFPRHGSLWHVKSFCIFHVMALLLLQTFYSYFNHFVWAPLGFHLLFQTHHSHRWSTMSHRKPACAWFSVRRAWTLQGTQFTAVCPCGRRWRCGLSMLVSQPAVTTQRRHREQEAITNKPSSRKLTQLWETEHKGKVCSSRRTNTLLSQFICFYIPIA